MDGNSSSEIVLPYVNPFRQGTFWATGSLQKLDVTDFKEAHNDREKEFSTVVFDRVAACRLRQ
jgi:hypothetical protein